MFVENRDFSTGKGPDGVPWLDEMAIEESDVPFEAITKLRPGHADTPGVTKYAQDDARNILERSSARESAARVAAGAVARRLLEEVGVEIRSHVTAIGGVRAAPADNIDWIQLEESPVRCADPDASGRMVEEIDAARRDGDSLGGVFEVIATGVPIGLALTFNGTVNSAHASPRPS